MHSHDVFQCLFVVPLTVPIHTQSERTVSYSVREYRNSRHKTIKCVLYRVRHQMKLGRPINKSKSLEQNIEYDIIRLNE